MRRRLLRSTLLVALVSLLLLGVPLGVVATKLIRDEAQKRMNREAAQLVSDLEGRISYTPLDSGIVSRYVAEDRYVTVKVNARVTTAGAPIHGSVQKGTATGSYNDVITVYASDSEPNSQILTVWLVVGGLGVVGFAVAIVLARLQARQFIRPLEDLVGTAERLGSGDPRPSGRHYGIPEFDRVARVLDRSADRIGQLLSSERELAVNASHQLRTPLTALSIRLEEIIATARQATVRDEAAAALAQAERLAAVVDSLLTTARTSRISAAVRIDVDDIVQQQRIEWEPAFRRAGRGLQVEGHRGLKAFASPGALAQVVATLLDNALTHGAGAVSLRTRNSGSHVVLEVADEGAGVPEDLAPRIFERAFSGAARTGIGLSLARDLVEADGGRLELLQARPAVFAIFLTPDAAT